MKGQKTLSGSASEKWIPKVGDHVFHVCEFILDDYGFMERMLDDEEHTTEDYGWIAPDGTFYAVGWGNHQEWAQQYIEEHFPEAAEDDEVDMQIHCNIGLIGAGDYLAEKGWVLLHSPSQGIAEPTKDPQRNYTKAQKEFLYDYYMERNKENKANEIWEK